MRRLILLLLFFPSLAIAAPDPPTGLAYGDPVWVFDGSYPQREPVVYQDGSENWLVGAFLGNFVTRSNYHDGPQLETGGMLRGGLCTQGNAKTYCTFGNGYSIVKKIVEIDETSGTAQIFMFNTGLYVGPTEDVVAGKPFYNAFNDTLYLGGSNCLRKIVDDGDGTRSVELVAGECGTDASTDGTGAAARFKLSFGWTAATDGNMYSAEIDPDVLRKITPAGVVTTITPTRPEYSGTLWHHAGKGGNSLHAGPDGSTLYIDDTYNGLGNVIYRADLTTGPDAAVLTRVSNVTVAADTYSRHGKENDGPALTYASTSGGAYSNYMPFYNSLFLYGNDTLRLRRLDPDVGDDGWVFTVMNSTRPGTITRGAYTFDMNQSATPYSFDRVLVNGAPHYVGYDDRGGIYVSFAIDLNMVWRAYNPAEGGSQ